MYNAYINFGKVCGKVSLFGAGMVAAIGLQNAGSNYGLFFMACSLALAGLGAGIVQNYYSR